MFPVRRFLWLALLLAPLTALVSCGDDDDNGTQPPPVDVPELPAPEVTSDVQFGSADANAQSAESMVEGQLALAHAMASMGQTYTAPLGGADWDGAGQGCWSYAYAYQACTWTYEVCEAAQVYTWTLTFDGDCGGEQVYDDWVAMRGTTTEDGREGVMRLYEQNSAVVATAWTWDIAVDDLSGYWLFYDGDVSSGDLAARLDWIENGDGSEDVTWIWYEQSKFVTHVSASGNAGWMELYDWDGNAWEIGWKIVWNGDGSGYWASYDAEGNETDRLTWTS